MANLNPGCGLSTTEVKDGAREADTCSFSDIAPSSAEMHIPRTGDFDTKTLTHRPVEKKSRKTQLAVDFMDFDDDTTEPVRQQSKITESLGQTTKTIGADNKNPLFGSQLSKNDPGLLAVRSHRVLDGQGLRRSNGSERSPLTKRH